MSSADEVIEVFCRIDDTRVMRRFFEEIFTPAERRDLQLRWEILKMVNEKIPQRTIAARLGVSLCKITRGAKVIKDKNSISRKYIEQGDKNL